MSSSIYLAPMFRCSHREEADAAELSIWGFILQFGAVLLNSKFN